MSNLTEHKCAGKCPEFKGDQCHHCLIQQIEKREFELGVALEDAYVKCGTSQVIDCTGISSKKVELRFKAGEVVVTASPEFKGGDWVVLANSVSREPSLAQILKTDGRWSIVQWLDDNTESEVRLDFLRHATDEEIAAGRRIEHVVESDDMIMGDDAHIENHISPLCKKNLFGDANDMVDSERLQQWKNNIPKFAGFRASNLSKNKSQDYLAIKTDAQIIAELKAENKMLHEAATTHRRNQKHFMDLYNRLIEQLYPYALDLEDPTIFLESEKSRIPKEYRDGYDRARECAHYNLLEMMESDVEYIKAQCGMLGGGAA